MKMITSGSPKLQDPKIGPCYSGSHDRNHPQRDINGTGFNGKPSVLYVKAESKIMASPELYDYYPDFGRQSQQCSKYL